MAATRRSLAAFEPDDVEAFRFTDLLVDAESGVIELRYALDDTVSFCERLELGPRTAGDERLDAGFARVARLLHLAAGVSYYKAAMCPRLVVETGPLSTLERQFCLDLYDKGLRELAWHNRLPLERHLLLDAPELVPAPPGASGPAPLAVPPSRIGVPVGGGKDSAVVVEALRSEDPVLLSVNGHPAAQRVAAAAGLPLQVVRRSIDPVLFELNSLGARNGHVPITAIVSLISVAAGFRYGYDTTVMALERSADEPTRTVTSSAAESPVVAVNHQWSKSSEFELSLSQVLATSVGPGVHYCSVLRDVSELAIARCFASLPQYHRAFLSCNRAFTRTGSDTWCGQCPKCRFVFLALATAMDPDHLVPVFGKDLLSDPGQVEGFRDLLEEGRKPFECVGTRAESMVAFDHLARRGPWREKVVVRALAPVVVSLQALGNPRAPGGAAADAAAGSAGPSGALPPVAAHAPDEPAWRLLDEVRASVRRERAASCSSTAEDDPPGSTAEDDPPGSTAKDDPPGSTAKDDPPGSTAEDDAAGGVLR